MDKSKLSMMKTYFGAEDGSPGSEEKLIEKIDHEYIENLMWGLPYYKKDSTEINPNMLNDQNTPDQARNSAARSWFEEKGMSFH